MIAHDTERFHREARAQDRIDATARRHRDERHTPVVQPLRKEDMTPAQLVQHYDLALALVARERADETMRADRAEARVEQLDELLDNAIRKLRETQAAR